MNCQISVTVPTVDLVPPRDMFCSIATVGGNPVRRSMSGLSSCSVNCRAYGDMTSMKRRCPSAKKISKARELFPEPESPVSTVISPRGTSRSTFFRLWWRAPRRAMTPSGISMSADSGTAASAGS